MKYRAYKITGIFVLSFFIIFTFSVQGFTQENEPETENEVVVDDFSMLFSFSTTKQADDTRLFEVKFMARNKENRKEMIAIVEAPINFYTITEDDEILLGTANTDALGIAHLTMPSDQKYMANEEGYITLLAKFEGNDVMDEEEEELIIKDIHLDLTLSVEDSVQMVFVKAFTLDSLGEEIPVEELDLILGVQGMISKLPLDEGSLENGEYEFEMPSDIPGDVNGELTIYAKIDDHEDFANVLKTAKAPWGTNHSGIQETKNTLWSKAAPIWMYVVLTIMLVGIWANYVYTVLNLIKIKKLGDN